MITWETLRQCFVAGAMGYWLAYQFMILVCKRPMEENWDLLAMGGMFALLSIAAR